MKYSELHRHSGLFGDWLEDAPSVRAFLPLRPEPAALKERAAGLKARQFQRHEIHRLLGRQAAEYGAKEKARENIDRLLSPDCTVVLASVPVSFAAGPLSVLLKCLTAAKIAAELESAGLPSVPVCWMNQETGGTKSPATITVLDRSGELRRLEFKPAFSVSGSGNEDRLVSSEIDECLSVMSSHVGLTVDDPILQDLKQAFTPGTPYRLACRRFLSTQISGLGIVLLDAQVPEFKELALRALSGSPFSIELATYQFCRQARQLNEAGYCRQQHEGDGGAEACSGDLQDSARPEGSAEWSRDRVAAGPYPQLFFEALLPVAAHVVDPGELCKFALATPILTDVGLASSLLWPRASATIVDARSRRIMEKYGIGLNDLFAGRPALLRKLGRESSAAEAISRLEGLERLVEETLRRIRDASPPGDGAGDISADTISKTLFQLEKLKERFAAASNLRREAVARQVDRLLNSLLPEGSLQEDLIAGLYFLLHNSSEFLRRLYDELDTRPFTHQLIHVE